MALVRGSSFEGFGQRSFVDKQYTKSGEPFRGKEGGKTWFCIIHVRPVVRK